MSVGISDSAVQGKTMKAKLGNLIIKKLSSNRTESLTTAADANTVSVTTSALSVQAGSTPGAQTIVKGVVEKSIGSVNLTASNGNDVGVTSMSFKFQTCTGTALTLSGNNVLGITNLKLRKKGSSSFLGSTLSNVLPAGNTFSFSSDTIAKSTTSTYELIADVSTAFVDAGVMAIVTQNGIAGSDTQSITVNAPTADTNLTCNTVSATNGSLSTLANASTSVSKVVTANTTNEALFTFDLSAGNLEPMRVKRLKVAIGNGNGAVAFAKLYQGGATSTTQVAGGSNGVAVVNGIAEFSGLDILVPKDSSITFTVKGDILTENSLDADTEMLGGLYYYEANGDASGQRVERYAATEKISTDAAESMAVGTPAILFKASAGAGTNTARMALVTTAGSGTTTQVISGHTGAAFGLLATDQVTVLPTSGSYASGTAVSTNMKVVAGDVVFVTDNSTTTGPVLSMVTSTTGLLANKADEGAAASAAYTSSATAMAAKLAVKAVETFNTTTATQHNYMKGDVVFGKLNGGAYCLGVATNSTAAKLNAGASFLRATGAACAAPAAVVTAAVAGDQVSTLSSLGYYESGFNSTNFAAGDVIVFGANTTTAVPQLGIVTAVSATDITVANVTTPGAPAAFAAGFASKLMTARGLGRTIAVEEVAPIVSIDAATPAGSAKPLSTEAQALLFKVNRSGTKNLTLKKLRFTVDGSYNSNSRGDLRNFRLLTGGFAGTLVSTGTNNVVAGTCAGNKTGFASGPTTACGNIIEFDLGAGINISSETVFAVTVDNTHMFDLAGTPTATITSDFTMKLDGTAGQRDVNNSVTYSYTSNAGLTILTNYLSNYALIGGSVSSNK